MPSRREFLTTVATALAASRATPAGAVAPQAATASPLNGPIGLQLWSLREYLPKDLPGTLAKVAAMGFQEVEGAGLWGHSAAEFRKALDIAGLRCQSAHMGYERLRDDAAGAFAEAKSMGASWVVCPWIPHDKGFTREVATARRRVVQPGRQGGARSRAALCVSLSRLRVHSVDRGHVVGHARRRNRSAASGHSGGCVPHFSRRGRSGCGSSRSSDRVRRACISRT